MRDQLLDILKYAFLALVYLFLLNVLFTIRRELRDPPEPSLAGPQARARARVRRSAPGEMKPPGPARPSRTKNQGRIRVAGSNATPTPVVDQLTIGRSPGCGCVVSGDATVSGVHARVFRSAGAVWIEDLNSTNGTYVNGARVTTPVRLALPTTFRCGDTELELVK